MVIRLKDVHYVDNNKIDYQYFLLFKKVKNLMSTGVS